MKKLAVFFLIFTCLNFPAGAAQETLDQVLDGLQERMSGVNRLQADFTQEKNLAMFNQALTLKGRISIQKPGMLSWKVSSPLRYGLVIKGGLVSQWDQDSDRVQSISLDKNPGVKAAIEQMQNWFSGTYKSMRGDYRITQAQEQPLKLEFIPKENSLPANFIQRVNVTFEADRQYIKQISILEKNGDSTLMDFTQTKINQDIDPKEWDVKAP